MVILNPQNEVIHSLLFPAQFSLYQMEKEGKMPLVWKKLGHLLVFTLCEAEYFRLMFLKYTGIAI